MYLQGCVANVRYTVDFKLSETKRIANVYDILYFNYKKGLKVMLKCLTVI